MTVKGNPLFSVTVKMIVAILLLFLCSTPVFYFMVSLDTNAYIYMSARTLRLLAVVVIGCFIRKRNQKELLNSVLLKRKFEYFIIGIVFISILLHFNNITPVLYATVSYSIGVYDLETTPLFLAVLWEQLFAGDLYWSMLLCLSIVFLDCPTSFMNKCREIVLSLPIKMKTFIFNGEVKRS